MTVCIAATCVHGNEEAIVFCCDWQGTKGDFIKTDDVEKIRECGKATVLLANQPQDADELINECEDAIKAFTAGNKPEDIDLHIDKFLSELRRAVGRRKGKLIEWELDRLFHISYEEFKLHGLQYFGPDENKKMWKFLSRISLNAALIIGALVDGNGLGGKVPVIVQVDSDGKVSERDNFTTIGSGSFIAEAFLHQYDWYTPTPLMQCLYRVYSAKVAAEKDPTVGQTTSIQVLCGERRLDWTDDLASYLNQSVRNKPEPEMEFKKEFLDEIK